MVPEWRRSRTFSEGQELYDFVIPVADRKEEQRLLDVYDNYRLYLLAEKGTGIGLALVAWLEQSRILHLDVFAIHPEHRNQGFGRSAYHSLVLMLSHEWP